MSTSRSSKSGNTMIEVALQGFLDHIDRHADVADLIAARAPGRVNLIGEHTDYNDGFVFPAAIDREIALVGRRRDDGVVKLFSTDYDQANEFRVDDIQRSEDAPWSNYIRGVVDVLQKAGYTVGGFEAAFAGDVPRGAGLSSSAALEVATITLIDALYGLNIDPVNRALLGQKAENEFVGVACGIMDQFISSTGKAGHGLFLDCRSLDYQLIPLHLTDASLVVVNTNKRRGLVDSEYNARRKECEEGARILADHIAGVKALRDVTPEQFEAHRHLLPQPMVKRCRHVVTECDRVLKSVEALKQGDLVRFGQLMDQSHVSLRDDFEVSCKELDAVVEIAGEVPGVLGARMTGAGFGGCAVILVRNANVDELIEQMQSEYPKRTQLNPEIYVFEAADGSGVVKLS